jgi:hypothetical protein
MSVNPEGTGEPPREADDYLKDANAEDPREDAGAPAHEPAGGATAGDDGPGSATTE